MTTRPSRSSSIPIPPSATASARSLENAITMPFNPSPTSLPVRPRPTSTISRSPDDRRGLALSATVNSSTFPLVRPLAASYSAATSARRTSPNRPPATASAFQPRIIRATSTPNPHDPACVSPVPEATSPSPSPARQRRSSVNLRSVSTGTPPIPVPAPRVVSIAAPSSPHPHGYVQSHTHVHSHTAFPPPAYLDYSAQRKFLCTDIASTFPPIRDIVERSHTRTSPPFAVIPYPYIRRELTPGDSDSESTASPPPPSRPRANNPAAILSSNPVLHLPTRWSDQDRCPPLSVSADGRDLAFNGPSCPGEHESAAARANYPIPPACGIYYYEVEILVRSPKGFSSGDVRLSRLPGSEKHSWGYRAEDGWALPGQKDGRPYGPTFEASDVIGCGVDFSQNKAFYTKNGVFLGMVFDHVGKSGEIFPAVGMRHHNDTIRANFGSAPFRYAIEDHVRAQRDTVWADVMHTRVNWAPFHVEHTWNESMWGSQSRDEYRGSAERAVSTTEQKHTEHATEEEVVRAPLQQLVLAYLSHHGYARTARAFQAQCARRLSAGSDLHGGGTPDGLRDGEAAMETDDGATALAPASDALPVPSTSTVSKDANDVGDESDPLTQDLRTRLPIVRAVQAGDVDTALDALREHHPNALAAQGGLLLFRLRCQKFVELVLRAGDALKRVREAERDAGTAKQSELVDVAGQEVEADGEEQMDVDPPDVLPSPRPASPSLNSEEPVDLSAQAKTALHTALAYGQALEADYKGDGRPGVRAHLRRTFGVVAYDEPARAGGAVGELAGQAARAALATEVNQAILESQGRPAHPSLETLFRQTGASVVQLGLLGVGAAAFTDVRGEFVEG
ncbi:SPRY-domain-containing protein [Amylocystis lapponica]|nr:SPRY-domain-containing protein [Amylocystis lapponica]